MKLIRGDQSYLRDTIVPLLDGGRVFFGIRYQKVLQDTLLHLYFYEQSQRETRKDVLEELMGKNVSIQDYPLLFDQEEIPVFYFLNEIDKTRKDQIIVYKKAPITQLQKSFAREIFGHAVCGYTEKTVIKNGKIYTRNGICLEDEEEYKNGTASEGFMELIAYEILEKTGIQITGEMVNLPYLIAYANAKFIYDEIGHQKVMNHLVLNQGNLMKYFNAGMKIDYFAAMEEMSQINLLENGIDVLNRCQENEQIQIQYIKEKYCKK